MKKFTDDPTLTWQERFERLEAHHVQETGEMADELNRQTIIAEAACDGLNKAIEARGIEELQGHPPYIPQSIAMEVLSSLERVGMGKLGKPNTLWAMVREAADELRTLRAVIAGEPYGEFDPGAAPEIREFESFLVGFELSALEIALRLQGKEQQGLSDVGFVVHSLLELLARERYGRMKAEFANKLNRKTVKRRVPSPVTARMVHALEMVESNVLELNVRNEVFEALQLYKDWVTNPEPWNIEDV